MKLWQFLAIWMVIPILIVAAAACVPASVLREFSQ